MRETVGAAARKIQAITLQQPAATGYRRLLLLEETGDLIELVLADGGPHSAWVGIRLSQLPINASDVVCTPFLKASFVFEWVVLTVLGSLAAKSDQSHFPGEPPRIFRRGRALQARPRRSRLCLLCGTLQYRNDILPHHLIRTNA